MTDKKIKASIAIEAALIIPFFFIGMMSVISICIMMTFHMKLQRSLCKEAKYLSIICSDGRNIAISDIRQDILNDISMEYGSCWFIDGSIQGIDMSESRLDNSEYVELKASYVIVPFGSDILNIVSIPISQKCVMHVWCGYENGYESEMDQEYVYVTNNSEVYHRNRECSHIRIVIRRVSSEEIDSIRNNGGGRYYSCDICNSSLSDANLYITSDGNRYHNSVSCSGIKRTVRAIRLSNIEGRRPCSRCGY